MRLAISAIILLTLSAFAEPLDLRRLQSPVLFRGDATTAYRDPAAIYSPHFRTKQRKTQEQTEAARLNR